MMRPTRHSQETTIEFTERELRYLMDRSLARLAFICQDQQDRKSTRLNSSHSQISYAVFCLKKKQQRHQAKPKRSSQYSQDPSPFLAFQPVDGVPKQRPDSGSKQNAQRPHCECRA